MPEAVTLNQAFAGAAAVLRRAGIDTPELDARLLLCHAAGLSHEAYAANACAAVQPGALARLDEAIGRRLRHEPVSRITGTREFYSRHFSIAPQALDPRPDTETLIKAALALVERRGWREKALTLLDLGTGTGCILITLLPRCRKRTASAPISAPARSPLPPPTPSASAWGRGPVSFPPIGSTGSAAHTISFCQTRLT